MYRSFLFHPILSFSLGLIALIHLSPTVLAEESTIHLNHSNPLVPALAKIESIQINGTQYLDSVRLIMNTREGDEVTPEGLEQERQRILKLGYFSDVLARLQKLKQGGYQLIVEIKEFSVLQKLELLTQPQILTADEIVKPFTELKDQVMNLDQLQSAQEAVETQYRRQGYTLAHLEVHEGDSGVLQLSMHEGLIKEIVFEGLKQTENQVISRELRQSVGQVFNQQIWEGDLTRLRNLGYFESLDLRPEIAKDDPHQFKLTLVAKEKQSRDIGFNFSLNNRDGILGGVHYTDTNFLGKGQYLNTQLQAGLDFFNLFSGQANQSQRSLFGRVDFSDPWLLPGRTAIGASLFSDRSPLFYGAALDGAPGLPGTENGLLQTRTGISLSLGRPLFGDLYSPWKGRLSFGAEQVELTDFSRVPKRELTLSKRFSATDVLFNVSGNLSYDTRDYILNPSRGVLGSVSAQPVWGDGSYLRVNGNINTYLPVIPEFLTLALGLQGGAFLGQQPKYEQFFATGPATIRGWQENGSLFGDKFVIGSAEARFPIWQPLSGVVFTDIGNFFSDTLNTDVSALPFKYGVGAGIRVETPMGLLRLDYGVRDFATLNWNSLLEAGQLHFSIGHKF